jgi:hypothetical protein
MWENCHAYEAYVQALQRYPTMGVKTNHTTTTDWHGHKVEVIKRGPDRVPGSSEYYVTVTDQKSHQQTTYLDEAELVAILNLFRHTAGREPLK